MTTVKVNYLGGLRTECTHVKSGVKLVTDAPVDNNGKGESFSPTDLFATSYASCMMTIIGIYCESNQLNFVNGSANILKVMGSDPRRVSALEIKFDLTGNGWSEAEQNKVRRAAEACPVAKSVSENMQIVLNYQFV
jgi:putative redox protein